MDPTQIVTLIFAAAIAPATVFGCSRTINRLRAERDAARLDLATEQALHLLTADQRDSALVDEARAVMHAEDAQLLLDAMVRHPSARPALAVLDGGA